MFFLWNVGQADGIGGSKGGIEGDGWISKRQLVESGTDNLRVGKYLKLTSYEHICG